MSALRLRVEISNDRRPHFMVLRALPEASAFQSYAGNITATVDSQRNISTSVSAFFGAAPSASSALRTAHTTAFDVSHHRPKTADDFLQAAGDLA